MTLTEMTNAANSYTDENYKATQSLYFVNEAIGLINAELGCELPFIDSVNSEYLGLSETWIRQLLIPYIAYSIKINDGSLQEASMFLRGFENGLQRLYNNKDTAIDSDYQGPNFGNPVVQIDYSTNLSGFGLYSDASWYVPEYNEYTLYYVGNYVYYNNIVYRCIKNNSGKVPTNSTYWMVYN